MTSHAADGYVAIGGYIALLQRTQTMTPAEVCKWLANLKRVSQSLSFDMPIGMMESFEKRIDTLTTQRMPTEITIQFDTLMHTITELVYKQAKLRQTIVLATNDVSQEVRNLPNALGNGMTDAQKHLHEETVRCLECGARRSAAVMSWNLAYDVIRQWVLNNHLAAFNAELVTYLRKGTPRYKPIGVYSDFMEPDAPNERTVIDVCRETKLVGDRVYDALKVHLRYRNEYAHPTGAVPTNEKVNTFIQDLIGIITTSPFV